MSIKLLAVDDEPIILNGIKNYVKWDRLGIQLIGAEANGIKALETLKNNPVDILVTDINMPYMNGIELSREAKKLYPDIKIILLTGYEEFEYARQAIDIGALKYLLKPFTRLELEETIRIAKEQLEERIRLEEDISLLKKRVEKSFPLLKERYLNRLITGELTENISLTLSSVEIELRAKMFSVILIQIDDKTEFNKLSIKATEKDIINAYMKEIIYDSLKTNSNSLIFNSYDGKTVCIFSDYNEEAVVEFAEKIRAYVKATYGITVSIGLGKAYEGLGNIYKSYEEAKEALEYRFLLGDNSIIPIEYINFSADTSTEKTASINASELISAVKSGDKASVRHLLKCFSDEIQNNKGISIVDIRLDLKQLVSRIILELLQSTARLKDIFSEDYDPYSQIDSYETLQEMCEGVESFLNSISSFIIDKRGNKKRSIIEKSLDFINSNYHEYELSINEVSEYISMNTSYYSRLFKQEMGITFTEYINKLRVEKAKMLLKNSVLRVSEISYKIGFKDPFYFSTIFKKYTGVNPTEYRED